MIPQVTFLPHALLLAALLSGSSCKSEKKVEAEVEEFLDSGSEETGAQIDKALANVVATCAKTTGVVEVRRKGEAHWAAIRIGQTFRAGDWIRTKANSTTRVQFLASGAMDLEQNTTIIVDESSVPGGDTTQPIVSIESGVAYGVMNREGENEIEPLQVVRQGGKVLLQPKSANVRYRLSAGEDGTELAIIDGDVELGGESVSQILSKGEQVKVRRSGLSKVTRMIGFPVSQLPGIDARFLFDADMSINLKWKSVKKAVSYRLQVATDLSFSSIIFDRELNATTGQFRPKNAGTYFWRVSAKDRGGQYGEHGFIRRIFCENAAPQDLLLTPTSGTRIAYDKKAPKVTFSWQSAGSTSSYRLVVGRGNNPMSNPVLNATTKAQVYRTSALTAGKYTWGVYIGSDNEPIFIKPRRLTIKQQKGARALTDGIWD